MFRNSYKYTAPALVAFGLAYLFSEWMFFVFSKFVDQPKESDGDNKQSANRNECALISYWHTALGFRVR